AETASLLRVGERMAMPLPGEPVRAPTATEIRLTPCAARRRRRIRPVRTGRRGDATLSRMSQLDGTRR
ncbi:MAG: hypothetical protein IJH84_12365, partial [Saccharopolyspora sp.]|uniref:hypothetical protein n=1 Tax=Saccharopolyspora sp. TaxID=33915 RepID=UPI0025D7030D